jgi:hypothetical protein
MMLGSRPGIFYLTFGWERLDIIRWEWHRETAHDHRVLTGKTRKLFSAVNDPTPYFLSGSIEPNPQLWILGRGTLGWGSGGGEVTAFSIPSESMTISASNWHATMSRLSFASARRLIESSRTKPNSRPVISTCFVLTELGLPFGLF